MAFARYLRKKLFTAKPSKPLSRGNALAFKVGARSFNKTNGATVDLQRVMMLALQNDLRLKK